VDFDQGSFVDAQRTIVVKVGLRDSPVLEGTCPYKAAVMPKIVAL